MTLLHGVYDPLWHELFRPFASLWRRSLHIHTILLLYLSIAQGKLLLNWWISLRTPFHWACLMSPTVKKAPVESVRTKDVLLLSNANRSIIMIIPRPFKTV